LRLALIGDSVKVPPEEQTGEPEVSGYAFRRAKMHEQARGGWLCIRERDGHVMNRGEFHRSRTECVAWARRQAWCRPAASAFYTP
jgi:hypothetical protein